MIPLGGFFAVVFHIIHTKNSKMFHCQPHFFNLEVHIVAALDIQN